jgi:hypothetical protein
VDVRAPSPGGDRFDQRQGCGFDQRQNRSFDQRQGSGFDQRQNSGFDQQQGAEFDQQRNSSFIQRHNSGFDQSQNSGFDQRENYNIDPRDGLNQMAGGGFDQRQQDGAFDQRQGSGFYQQDGNSFEQRGGLEKTLIGRFGAEAGGRARRRSGEGRAPHQGFSCYEEDFEYDSSRGGGQLQESGGGSFGFEQQHVQSSPWVGDPANTGPEGGAGPAFIIGQGGAGARRQGLGPMFGQAGGHEGW